MTSKKQTSRMPRPHGYSASVAALALCACTGQQSTLAPRGPNAQVIADISWVMFWGAGFILVLVMSLALYAFFRKSGTSGFLSSNKLIIAGGIVFPVVSLTALLVYGVFSMGTLRAQPSDAAVRIDVVGNRWWWDIRYLDKTGKPLAVTANEIRIPAGQDVAVTVRTNDVIHSFWVPNLAGKIDLIPGRTNHILIKADRPGIFRGQCAEFCGAQHARMAFHVIAETPQQYDAWLRGQMAPARIADDIELARGLDAFRQQDCAACHTVRGISEARGQGRGPDLTHFASRKFIGAGTLENNRSNLMQFIAHSQRIKPANGMPDYAHLEEPTLHSLAVFLESLR